jgi:hypothetical protein
MEELLGTILVGIVELLGEVLLEGAFGELTGLLSRVVRRFRVTVRRSNPILATVVFALVGVAFGFLSAWMFPHPLVHPSKVHGISLLISPIVAGPLMAQIGRTLRSWGRQSVRIESFGYGFVFAFAMAVVRLLLMK